MSGGLSRALDFFECTCGCAPGDLPFFPVFVLSCPCLVSSPGSRVARPSPFTGTSIMRKVRTHAVSLFALMHPLPTKVVPTCRGHAPAGHGRTTACHKRDSTRSCGARHFGCCLRVKSAMGHNRPQSFSEHSDSSLMNIVPSFKTFWPWPELAAAGGTESQPRQD